MGKTEAQLVEYRTKPADVVGIAGGVVAFALTPIAASVRRALGKPITMVQFPGGQSIGVRRQR